MTELIHEKYFARDFKDQVPDLCPCLGVPHCCLPCLQCTPSTACQQARGSRCSLTLSLGLLQWLLTSVL